MPSRPGCLRRPDRKYREQVANLQLASVYKHYDNGDDFAAEIKKGDQVIRLRRNKGNKFGLGRPSLGLWLLVVEVVLLPVEVLNLAIGILHWMLSAG